MTKVKAAWSLRLLRTSIFIVSVCCCASGGQVLALSWDNLSMGKFYVPVAYIMVHGSFLHLLVNFISFGNISKAMTARYGGFRSVLIFFATGAAGGLLALVGYPFLVGGQASIVGSSGALCGWIGYMLYDLFREKQWKDLSGIAINMLLIGFLIPTSTLIHISCLVVGFLIRFVQPKT